ncbi:MAG: UbiA prenyltransferase family protein [Arenicellales bacterium]
MRDESLKSRTPLRSVVAPYVQLARFDHWLKNVFMLPGVLVAMLADPDLVSATGFARVALGLLAAGIAASANYILNELMDEKSDAFHPVKRSRPLPSGLVSRRMVVFEWVAFAVVGLCLASVLGPRFLGTVFALLVMGCVYNVPPVRSKDKPYLDVLSESINNAIRFVLGWYATGIVSLPSVSLLFAYWMVGAFFMAIKRLAEYRRIGDPDVSARYRKSFGHYNEEKLLKSIIYYATAFGLFFGIFLIRYRMELILSTPLIAGFMTWYLHLGLLEDSPAQYPERLFKQGAFVAYVFVCCAVVLTLLFVPIPILHRIFQSSFTLR